VPGFLPGVGQGVFDLPREPGAEFPETERSDLVFGTQVEQGHANILILQFISFYAGELLTEQPKTKPFTNLQYTLSCYGSGDTPKTIPSEKRLPATKSLREYFLT